MEHFTSQAPRRPVKQKVAPFHRFACFVHGIFNGADCLADKKLRVDRSFASQRKWASCVKNSETAKNLLAEEMLTNGRARMSLAQKLTKEDAVELIPKLEHNGGMDDGIIAVLKRKYKI